MMTCEGVLVKLEEFLRQVVSFNDRYILGKRLCGPHIISTRSQRRKKAFPQRFTIWDLRLSRRLSVLGWPEWLGRCPIRYKIIVMFL